MTFRTVELDVLRERRSEKWRKFPADVLPSHIAEMDFAVAPPIEEALTAAVQAGDLGYVHAKSSGLYEAFADFAQRRWNWQVDPESVVAVPDVMVGVAELLRLLTPEGSGVVINPPVYPPFFSVIAEAGRRVVEVPLVDGRLPLLGIRDALSAGARAVLFCNPHNPTGRVFSREELESVAALADRYGVIVFADEVHAPLTYPGSKHVPFMSLDADSARGSVTMVSASKAWNLPGLKCAMVVTGSAERWDRLATLPDEVRYGAGIGGLIANEAAFREGTPWLDDTIGYLGSNVSRVADLLRDRLPGVRWVPPEATYLGWLDCSALGLGDDPAEAFEERGRVALTHGPPFGTGGEGFARLNLATTRAILEEAIDRMARAVGS